ncbi:type II toxin-antitoxin system Phd/YefM family antitoxin [soil metagenome]
MKLSTQIKSISYLKANAAEVVRQLAEQRKPLVITQNGEAKAVIQDVASYEETQETLALLKLLALGNRQIEEGKVVPATDAISRLREKKARG